MADSELLPSQISDFQDKGYWEAFFTKLQNKTFEWYGETSDLWPVLQRYVKPGDSVLHVGVGNSSLAQDLYDHGVTNAQCVDLSEVAVAEMEAKKGGRSGLQYHVMDVMAMEFASATFDQVIDKATFDAIMIDCEEGTRGLSLKMTGEICRVLKAHTPEQPHHYVMVTLLQHHIIVLILEFMQKHQWSLDIVSVRPQSSDSNLLPFVCAFHHAEHVTVRFEGLDGDTRDIPATVEDVEIVVEAERKKFGHAIKALRQRSVVVLHVKPWEAEQDMSAVGEEIKGMDWDGVTWTDQKITPIGYGISRLELTCILVDVKISPEEMVAAIEEACEETVQSVDVASFAPLQQPPLIG